MNDWIITNAYSGATYDPADISFNVTKGTGSTSATIRIPDYLANIDSILNDFQQLQGKFYSIKLPNFTIALKVSGIYSHAIGGNSGVTLSGDIQYTTAYDEWAASTDFETDSVIIKGGNLFAATNDGVSGTAEPSWPTTIGSSVTDGGIDWVNVGPYYIGTTSLVDPFDFDDVLSEQIQTTSITYSLLLNELSSQLWIGDYIKYSGETRIINSLNYSIKPGKRTIKITTGSA